MTKEQAIQLMEQGKKVTHRYFSRDEFITIKDGKIFTEDGYSCTQKVFWGNRTIEQWNDGWEEFVEKKTIPSPVSGSLEEARISAQDNWNKIKEAGNDEFVSVIDYITGHIDGFLDGAAYVKKDYEEVVEGHKRLVRELDEIINGKEGMAKQASLCDIVAQLRKEYVKGGEEKLAAWNMAIRLAHNECVRMSDDWNNDDYTIKADAADQCAKRIRTYIDNPVPELGSLPSRPSLDIVDELRKMSENGDVAFTSGENWLGWSKCCDKLQELLNQSK